MLFWLQSFSFVLEIRSSEDAQVGLIFRILLCLPLSNGRHVALCQPRLEVSQRCVPSPDCLHTLPSCTAFMTFKNCHEAGQRQNNLYADAPWVIVIGKTYTFSSAEAGSRHLVVCRLKIHIPSSGTLDTTGHSGMLEELGCE